MLVLISLGILLFIISVALLVWWMSHSTPKNYCTFFQNILHYDYDFFPALKHVLLVALLSVFNQKM